MNPDLTAEWSPTRCCWVLIHPDGNSYTLRKSAECWRWARLLPSGWYGSYVGEGMAKHLSRAFRQARTAQQPELATAPMECLAARPTSRFWSAGPLPLSSEREREREQASAFASLIGAAQAARAPDPAPDPELERVKAQRDRAMEGWEANQVRADRLQRDLADRLERIEAMRRRDALRLDGLERQQQEQLDLAEEVDAMRRWVGANAPRTFHPPPNPAPWRDSLGWLAALILLWGSAWGVSVMAFPAQ